MFISRETYRILRDRDAEFRQLHEKLESLEEQFRQETESVERRKLSREIEKLGDKVNARISIALSA